MEKGKKKVPLELFQETAHSNGYEVFTSDEVASFYKEGMMKSRSGQLSDAEIDEFIAEAMYLQKAVCCDKEGKDVIMYYRPEQVEWEVTDSGTVLKGLEGVFKDTPTNRRLNRVGEAFVPSEKFLKSLFEESEEGGLMKSIDLKEDIQFGCYSDTPGNRKLKRVGKPYQILIRF